MKTNQTDSAAVLAWHFCRSDLKTRYSNEDIAVGATLSAKGTLELCENGMHASIRVTDALRYAPGWTICRVELYGTILHGDDKLCARHRRVIALADAKRALLEFAADCAERALLRIKTPDPRSVQAVQAVRDYAAAKIDAAKLRDFRDAAYKARSAAADVAAAAAAAYAAYAAYAAAAADAADAAYAAADAYAARKDERAWQENALSKRLLELLGLPLES